ncbi:MAG TPA: hypothetical protein VM407_11295 [Acidovorax sp.]|nr:hypothetical protein [Acidovorax sp.]
MPPPVPSRLPGVLDPSAEDLAFDMAALYRRAHVQAGPGTVVKALHLGQERSLVVTGQDPASPAVVCVLALGSAQTARDFFRSALPTPLELETAIAWVEDEVHAARRRQPDGVADNVAAVTCSTDASLHEVATLAGIAPGAARVLSLDAVERLFHRLAAVAQGRPAAHEGLPERAEFAATVLVLRELMHHMPFAAVVLLGGDDPESAPQPARVDG